MTAPSDADPVVARVGVTRAELEAAVAGLDPGQAATICARMQPALMAPVTLRRRLRHPLVYASWEDDLTKTTPQIRRRWCAKKATGANSRRPISDEPTTRVTADDMMAVLHAARAVAPIAAHWPWSRRLPTGDRCHGRLSAE